VHRRTQSDTELQRWTLDSVGLHFPRLQFGLASSSSTFPAPMHCHAQPTSRRKLVRKPSSLFSR